MEGNLATIPLQDVLEMIHSNRRSGVLRLEAGELPLVLRFSRGEVVGGGIFDWEGLEAIGAFPFNPSSGSFSFVTGRQEGVPLLPLPGLVAEWARQSDEWDRFREALDSPSRVLEAAEGADKYQVFAGGKSIRTAAKAWQVPLVTAAERAWKGVYAGQLRPVRKYAWFGLRIRHPLSRRTFAEAMDPNLIAIRLDGSRNLGEIIQLGFPLQSIRRFLVKELLRGELRPSGRGWLLRDLLWEIASEEG